MSENPYATPESDVAPLLERTDFKDIPTKELKTLRNDSHTIRAAAFLAFLGLFLMGVAAIVIFYSGSAIAGPEFLILSVLAGLYLAAAIGLTRRTHWGRIIGFVVASLMIFGFPLGTIIGILVLVSLARGRLLFGPDRLQHKALETEWRFRKRNKIA